MLTKQEPFLEKGTWAERCRVRGPRAALPRGSQSRVLWRWDEFPGCLLLTFPNSSGLLWLISSVFFSGTSCPKTTLANGYGATWPGWAVSVRVLPPTAAL